MHGETVKFACYIFGKAWKIFSPFGNRTPSIRPEIKFFSQIILLAKLPVVSNFIVIVG